MMRPPTIGEVLASLSSDVALTPEATERARVAVASIEAGAPWYLRLLMGIGAWIGTWFMLAFVLGALAVVFEGAIEAAAILCGLVLIAAAVWLRRRTPNEFLQIGALVVSLTGQALFLGGVGAQADGVHAAAVAGLLISIALIVAFPDRVHRVLSTLGAATALAVLIFEARTPYGGDALVIGLLGLVLWMWRGAPLSWRGAQAEIVSPVATGALLSIVGLLLLSSLLGFAELSASRWLTMGGPVTAASVLGLLWLTHAVLDEHEPGRFGAEGVAASAAILALGGITWRAPAIVTTLLIVLLAFDRRSRTLLGLGVAFFLAFGALYYYNLEMTLLTKSGVLAGSGLLCLAAWLAVRRWSTASTEASA